MFDTRETPDGMEYLSRSHEWAETDERQRNPHTKRNEIVYECSVCGQRSVARLFATQDGPSICEPRWRSIEGLADSLKQELRCE